MTTRRAILVGVPYYRNSAWNLPFIVDELKSLHAILEKSNYEVAFQCPTDEQRVSRSDVLSILTTACDQAQPDETLVLYFSGHGGHYDGTDYLVTGDATLDNPEYITEYLLSLDLINQAINKSNAKAIIFIIDACREGIRLRPSGESKSLFELAPWGEQQQQVAAEQASVVMFSCSKRKKAQYSSEKGYSLFTHALTQVLDPSHPAQTVKTVKNATQMIMNQLIAELGKQPQEIRLLGEELDMTAFDPIICDSEQANHQAAKEKHPWLTAALHSPLWSSSNTPLVKNFQDAVRHILDFCITQQQKADKALPDDPWRDEKLPIRVLGCLKLLVDSHLKVQSQVNFQLEPAEVALLIVTPFVRESVLAKSIQHMAEHMPLDLTETGASTGLRGDLEKVHRGQAILCRKVMRLREIGKATEADWVALWLMHRCVLRTAWLSPEKSPLVTLPPMTNAPELVSKILTTERLRELAQCLFANPERLQRQDRPHALRPIATVSDANYEERSLRETLLGWLLVTAGGMAFDPRVMPEVLVEHVGLSNTPSLAALIADIDMGKWLPSGTRRQFNIACQHPAVDVALRDSIDHANVLLVQAQAAAEHHVEQQVLQYLPTRLSAEEVRAKLEKNCPVYQTPHIRFRLSQQQVLELLMGEQLYGDPTLAIRELYQNALDACRYARARLQYLYKSGQHETLSSWSGQITFREGVDETGRAYIECEDNGIGMGMRELQACFSVAGHRFADMPEFLEEQAAWSEYDIQLYPNSQFGIGVLSYFMLADEFVVETCRMNRDGSAGEAWRVMISGSGSLFQVQAGTRCKWGTQVRLYLNKLTYNKEYESNVPISCVDTLKELLWIAEFLTTAINAQEKIIWNAGQLGYTGWPKRDQYLATACSDLYWTKNLNIYGLSEGVLLADGLYIETGGNDYQLINLRNQQYPKLSVNRKHVHKWDKAWAAKQAAKNWQPIVDWQQTDLAWLTDLPRKIASYTCDLMHKKHQILPVLLNSTEISRLKKSENHIELYLKGICLNINGTGFIREDYQFIKHIYEEFAKHISKKILSQDQLLEVAFSCYPNYLATRRMADICDACPDLPVPHSFTKKISTLTPLLYLRAIDCTCLLNQLALDEIVPIFRIMFAAIKLQKTVAEVIEYYQQLGFSTPEIDLNEIVQTNQMDESLVSVNLDIEEFDIWWEVHGTIPLGHIFLAAKKLQLPLSAISTRMQQLGFITPELNLDKIGEITQQDIILLSKNLNGYSPWLSKEQPIPLLHILFATEKLHQSAFNIGTRLQQLGFTISKEAKLDETTKITQQDRILLLKDLGENAFFRNFRLELYESVPPEHIFLAAEKFNISIAEINTRLQELGFKIPKIDFDKISRPDSILFPKNTDYIFSLSSTDKVVPVGHILFAAEKLQKSIPMITTLLQQLGFAIPVINLDQIGQFTRQDIVLLSENLDEKPPWLDITKPVWANHIPRAADKLQKTPIEITKRLEELGYIVVPTIEFYQLPETHWRSLRFIFPENLKAVPTAEQLIKKHTIQLTQAVLNLPAAEAKQYLQDLLARVLPKPKFN